MAEKKVAKTSSKEVIYAAYQEALKKLKEKESMVTDPYAEQKQAEARRQEKSAAEFIESGFVSAEVVQKYKDLKAEIAQKETVLKELYDIEAEGAKFAAMHNAYKVTKIELDDQAKMDADERKAEKDAQIAQINADIKEAQDNLKKTKKELDEEEKAYKKDLAQQRNREAEEFKYNLERSRSKENDAWEDEKTAREKALAERELDLTKRTDAVTAREEKMEELEKQIAEFPKRLEEAETKGKTEGKAEADKAHAFEKRAMEKNAEYEKNLLQAKVDAQTIQIQSQNEKIQALEKKLDDAYVRNQELATTVAKNSGSTTYVTQSDNAPSSKK
jgi:DNA repair exonuclease SbcCD ATPase subunit